MKKSIRLPAIVAAVGLGLLSVQFVQLTPDTVEKRRFAEQVNLALRRTAHHLLVRAGDSTSRILPVRQTGNHTFQVRLPGPLAYDQLPRLLQESFRLHQIGRHYDVAVLDCARGELQLGYHIQDLTGGKSVPCAGRQRAGNCYDLRVTFADSEAGPPPLAIGWGGALLILVAGLIITLWRRTDGPKTEERTDTPAPEAAGAIQFGQSRLIDHNQTLVAGDTRHNLTYREAKLLRLFAEHPNQLLERDFILKAVWEDEGIIVGRSVDVFVSRLRKLLQTDSTVRLVAVHGVGYRMEVRP